MAAKNGGNELQNLPETIFTSESFSEFIDCFPCGTITYPYLYTEEEGGEMLLMELTYSFSAIIYNDGVEWGMEAFIYNFGFAREDNVEMLKNLRTALQIYYEESAMQHGMVGIHSTTERLRFDFVVLSCDEMYSDREVSASDDEASSEFSLEDLMQTDEEGDDVALIVIE